MGSCPLIEGYIQAGKASRGTDSRLYLPDGWRIRVQGTCFLRECLDRLPALAPAPPSSVVTSGIFSVTNSTTDAILDIKPLVFMAPVDQDSVEESDPALADPDFQAYIANAWATFQADRKDKGKRVRFDSVEMPAQKTGHPGPLAASVAEEVISPPIKAMWSKSATPPKVPAPVANRPPSSTPPSTSIPFQNDSANTPSFNPQGQFRYLFPLKDETAPKCLLDRVLATTVLVPVQELIAVAPEVHKQLKDLSMAKHIPVSTNTVQVNELAGRDPSEVDWAFGDRVHQSDDGLIVVHHSVPLRSPEAKIVGTGRSILGVLDSGSKIVAMPKQVWEDLGLPVWSDHVMTMSNANTSTESTLGVVENLHLDFGAGEICLQVQVVPRANFDLLLGQPFHCLLSASTEDFLDSSQTITLRDPNLGKAYKLPTRAWTKGCLCC